MQNNQAIPFNKENFKQILSREFAWVIIVSVPGALVADYFNVPLIVSKGFNPFKVSEFSGVKFISALNIYMSIYSII